MKFKCDCEWTEQANQIPGGAKGYTLVTECNPCRVRREQQNADQAVADAAAKEEQDKDVLIQGKTRELAIVELKKEGKLDESGNIKKEK